MSFGKSGLDLGGRAVGGMKEGSKKQGEPFPEDGEFYVAFWMKQI